MINIQTAIFINRDLIHRTCLKYQFKSWWCGTLWLSWAAGEGPVLGSWQWLQWPQLTQQITIFIPVRVSCVICLQINYDPTVRHSELGIQQKSWLQAQFMNIPYFNLPILFCVIDSRHHNLRNIKQTKNHIIMSRGIFLVFNYVPTSVFAMEGTLNLAQ